MPNVNSPASPSPADTYSIQDLLTPDAFPHPVGKLELRETHISWVVLTGALAYKIRKPVKLDFFDATTLELRRHFSEEELRLNRRLAPELYLDVVPITSRGAGAVVGGDGPILDYAVRMNQFRASDELPELLARGEIEVSEIARLAELIARFHLDAPVARWTGVAARTEHTMDAVLRNLASLVAQVPSSQPTATLPGLIEWTYQAARSLQSTCETRERGGFVRECHGDLHAANVVRLQNRLVPFDCLEFDPRLRWIDVMDDIAFLVMDLVSHDRPDLAFALLSRYLEVSGDYDGVELLPFYAVYRALVRAKVDAIGLEQMPPRAAEFADRLNRRVRAAHNWTMPHRPALVLTHGPSGSGKSWLSERLVAALPALRIRSDLERKRLAGLGPNEPAAAPVRQGIYSAPFTHRTYSRLLDSAENCLRAGFDVIVDAAFLEKTQRELFVALAARTGAALVIASCQADPVTLAGRVLDRSARRIEPSDANLAVLDAQLREIQPFAAEEEQYVIRIDTSDPHAVQRTATAVRERRDLP